MRPNLCRGRMQHVNRHLHAFTTLSIARWVVRRTSFAASTIKYGELRRSDAPVAAGLSWHHVEVVVGHFLAAVDAVVLKGQDA